MGCFKVYKKSIHTRYDIILHHLYVILSMFVALWPKAIYMWTMWPLYLATEISTPFLNMQWFAKHLKWKKLRKISQIGFLITWFTVRLPIVVYLMYALIKDSKRIIEASIVRFIGISSVAVVAYPIQIMWTIFIIWKAVLKLAK